MTVEIYDLDRKFLLDSYLLNVSLKAYTTTKAYTLIDGKNISALSALQHPKVRLPFLFRVPVSIQIWKVVCQVSFPLSENLSCRWNGTWKLVGKQLLMFVHNIVVAHWHCPYDGSLTTWTTGILREAVFAAAATQHIVQRMMSTNVTTGRFWARFAFYLYLFLVY